MDSSGANRRAERSAIGSHGQREARSDRFVAAVARSVDGLPSDASATGSDEDRSITGDLVDPDRGPTNRSELLEYGLTPAEYVRAVLIEHGGRIKQRRFAERYGWAHATLSRLLSELEERNVIDRYRLGREKVVCLPDAIPEAAR
ncbi:helix-turn-helix transcriptional regulator [Natrinema altunense]|uniref:MarR family transcriptional regulator n=1 Tax=Natrinema altunense TaxID=222984 RepID=A0A482Y3D7_9EURY|nr:MarR family transcriptional regulator [Natrinema altunense]RZH67267.1 MarR family transcriptional regulator [Natrinema altunense]